MSVDYYHRDGRPFEHQMSGDIKAWAQEMDSEEKRVAETTVGGTWVSTVWLGLDHSYFDGPPLIFETMVFGGEHDQWCERYSTEAAALAGHDQIVAALRDGKHPEGL